MYVCHLLLDGSSNPASLQKRPDNSGFTISLYDRTLTDYDRIKLIELRVGEWILAIKLKVDNTLPSAGTGFPFYRPCDLGSHPTAVKTAWLWFYANIVDIALQFAGIKREVSGNLLKGRRGIFVAPGCFFKRITVY